MPPHEGLTHLENVKFEDSNIALLSTPLDHKVKHASAATEPAWNNGVVGQQPGLFIWRIEDFAVVPWPKEKAGQFYDGDSFIVLHSVSAKNKSGQQHLFHEIFFWLGNKTTQDEAGTAAYKTVELDEFLNGAAVQQRVVQAQPSEEFLALFPHYQVRVGGVRSGFHHVEESQPKEILTLLRIFKLGRTEVVHEVAPTWQSLDAQDVFVLDTGAKIWVWQGSKASPMEKAKAAQVVNDMTLAKHIDVEVLAQTEARSRLVVDLLGGKEAASHDFQSRRPVSTRSSSSTRSQNRLLRLSDASGQLSLQLIQEGEPIRKRDLDSNDVFILDNGTSIWVWRGERASEREKAMWIKAAQVYIQQQLEHSRHSDPHLVPYTTVVEGRETPAFLRLIEP